LHVGVATDVTDARHRLVIWRRNRF